MRPVSTALLSVAVLFAAASVSAQIVPEQGKWILGVYGGVYQPSYDYVDDAGTGGLRLGYGAAEKVMVNISVGIAELDADAPTLTGELETTVAEVTTSYILGSGALGLELFVGGGYAWIDDDLVEDVDPEFGVCGGPCQHNDNTWTLSAGLGPVLKLGPVNLHLQYRWRYFIDRQNDEIDGEAVAALMIPVGGRTYR